MKIVDFGKDDSPAEPDVNPGSPEAIARGCICDPVGNNDGGGLERNDLTLFFPDPTCPVHGLAAVAHRK